MTRTLQAIVFDFDGVIANSEPLHLQAFQETLAEAGITLTAADYYRHYLGYDDVGAFTAIARDRGITMDPAQVTAMVERKGVALQARMRAGSVLFPGARAFIEQAAAAVPIGIASGALRHEIEEIIEAAGLASLFLTIVASGDTPESKPSPAPYRLAFENLRRVSGRDLDPRRTVAIEDSRWGLESARAAGLRCVGVTNSYPAEELAGAEIVASGLAALTIDTLEGLVQEDVLLPRP
jgi:HAD superfamily hydrolase (TIGR01509 family)